MIAFEAVKAFGRHGHNTSNTLANVIKARDHFLLNSSQMYIYLVELTQYCFTVIFHML